MYVTPTNSLNKSAIHTALLVKKIMICQCLTTKKGLGGYTYTGLFEKKIGV